MEAYSTLNRGAFGLYLYLCGNKNGFHLGLSSAAVQKALGISDSTYRRAKKALIQAGYLIEGRNTHDYHFYPTPRLSPCVKKEKDDVRPVVDDEPQDDEVDIIYAEPPRSQPYHGQYSWSDD